jgi:hypothetical protein
MCRVEYVVQSELQDALKWIYLRIPGGCGILNCNQTPQDTTVNLDIKNQRYALCYYFLKAIWYREIRRIHKRLIHLVTIARPSIQINQIGPRPKRFSINSL